MAIPIIKVCGITTPEDAIQAFAAGVDVIGLNFVAGPRRIDLRRAGEILEAATGDGRIWILLDLGQSGALDMAASLASHPRVTHVQVYGDLNGEDSRSIGKLGLGTVKVIHADTADFAARTTEWLDRCRPRAEFVLLDSGGPANLGGTGRCLNWGALGEMRRSGVFDDWPPLVLAGGITAENVTEAIRTVEPQAIDVSSGVESSPGRKDAAKIAELVAAVRRAGLRPAGE